MNEMVTVKVRVSTNKIGSECEDSYQIEKEIWGILTEDEREEDAREMMWEMIEWDYEVSDE